MNVRLDPIITSSVEKYQVGDKDTPIPVVMAVDMNPRFCLYTTR
jgi:hypothetical protein